MRIAKVPDPNLEVKDLRLVLALSSSRTTAKAAEALHLAQPSVSRALLSLEDRLGARLFDRTSRGLVPTEAAERLAARAVDILGELGELEHQLRAPVEYRAIRLVCECYTAYHWLPATLAQLKQGAPELSISLHLEHTEGAVDAVAAGDLDAALVTSPCKSDDTMIVRKLFADEMLFLVSEEHPLAGKAKLSPDDLCEYPLFAPPPTPHEARWFLASIFGRSRPTLDVARIPLIEAIADLARASMGIGVITEWVAEPRLLRGCVVKRLKKGSLERPWRLAWRREIGDAGPRLLKALQSTDRRQPALRKRSS